MALGNATVGKRVSTSPGPVYAKQLSFAGDGAYPTGGTTEFQQYVRDALGIGNVTVLAVVANDCGGFVPAYDPANDTLKVYTAGTAGAALDEAANDADLSGTTFRVLVLCE